MTTDLWMLTATAVLSAMLPLTYLFARITQPGGLEYGLGNRDGIETLPPYAQRAQRAHNNMNENLAAFAALVLIAHVSGHANETTALGATIFFFARIAHAAVYILGIKVLRTLVFFVGMAGEILILSQILG